MDVLAMPTKARLRPSPQDARSLQHSRGGGLGYGLGLDGFGAKNAHDICVQSLYGKQNQIRSFTYKIIPALSR